MAGALAYVLSSCQDVLDVDAVGVMVRSRSGRLQLLAASTHSSAELELHQSQVHEGPCVDAADEGRSVALAGEGAISARWPSFGPAMIAAGFRAVNSAPLAATGTPFGAMALFRRESIGFDDSEDAAAQAYADLVTRLVVREADAEEVDLVDLADAALASRVTIERAKGIVAEVEEVDTGEAYELLRHKASREGRTLTETADHVVERRIDRSAVKSADPRSTRPSPRGDR